MELTRDVRNRGAEDTLVKQQKERDERNAGHDHEQSEASHIVHFGLCGLCSRLGWLKHISSRDGYRI